MSSEHEAARPGNRVGFDNTPPLIERWMKATGLDEAFLRALPINILCLFALLTLPAMLGAIARDLSLDDRAIGFIASAEYFGVMLGFLVVTNRVGHELKTVLIVGCIFIVAGNALGAAVHSQAPLMLCRAATGIGGGIAAGVSFKSGAIAALPDRNFGVMFSSQFIFSAASFQILPRVVPHIGIRGLFLIYAALGVVALVACQALRFRADGTGRPVRGWQVPPRAAMLGVGGLLTFVVGEYALWAFLERIGTAHGYTLVQVGIGLSMIALAGIVAGMIVAVLPAHLSRRSILVLGIPAMFAAVLGIVHASSLTCFLAACIVLGLYLFSALPTIYGVISRADPTGRATVLAGSLAGVGQSVGPAIAGTLVVNRNYAPIGWMTTSLIVAGIAMVIVSLRLALQYESAERAAP